MSTGGGEFYHPSTQHRSYSTKDAFESVRCAENNIYIKHSLV